MPTDQELLQAYTTANLTQALGEHFTLGELVRSDKAIEFHILNFPADGRQPLVTGLQVVQNLALLTKNVLDKIRAQFGDTRINSGYRCAELNKRVGGVARSDHLYGCAADIHVPGKDNYVVASWIRDNLTFHQVILEGHAQGQAGSGWVQVSYVDSHNDKQSLTMHNGNYVDGLNNTYLV